MKSGEGVRLGVEVGAMGAGEGLLRAQPSKSKR